MRLLRPPKAGQLCPFDIPIVRVGSELNPPDTHAIAATVSAAVSAVAADAPLPEVAEFNQASEPRNEGCV